METKPHLSPHDIQRVIDILHHGKILKVDTLSSFRDGNFMVTLEDASDPDSSKRIIVKATHQHDHNDTIFDVRRKLMQCLKQDGFICSCLTQMNNGSWFHSYTTSDEDVAKETYIITIYNYISGETLSKHIGDINGVTTVNQVGELVSLLHQSMKNFTLSCDVCEWQTDDDMWLMDNFCMLEGILKCIEDKEKQDVIREVIRAFKATVLPVYDTLPKGMIHGDIHDYNIIVNYKDGDLQPLYNDLNPRDVKSKYALIDFNDSWHSSYIFEVAMVIRDFMTSVRLPDNLCIGAHVLGGYLKHQTLSADEMHVLPLCVAAGLCQYIVLGEYEFQKQPSNEYRRLGADEAWHQLRTYWKHSLCDILTIWKRDVALNYDISLPP